MSWEIVIGFETHVQLATQSKIFSGASTQFGAPANTQASAVDLALPGTLPVLNRRAVEYAIRLGLAIDAKIARHSIFARKNYFYPDLPKGYQISQFEHPVIEGGTISFCFQHNNELVQKTVQLTRAHLEEDAGKSLHDAYPGMSGIDLNRAGTPLLEIVTEPDMRSAAEAVAYAKALHALVMWLGICDGNMQEGSFRCDANVSVRKPGQAYGTRCEIKNLNSFRFLEEAIQFEARRQIQILEDGGRIIQETRLYDPKERVTRSMRSKENAHDYRYFPDPDLPPLLISEEWINTTRASLPELPSTKQNRFMQYAGISAYDASLLTQSRELAEYFEQVITYLGQEHAKLSANWVLGELSALINEKGMNLNHSPISAAQLAGLLRLVINGTVSQKIAKEIFSDICIHPSDDEHIAQKIVEEKSLQQISNSDELQKIIDQVITDNPQSVEEYKAGKTKAFQALVGQVMKATQGKANPAQVNQLLKEKL